MKKLHLIATLFFCITAINFCAAQKIQDLSTEDRKEILASLISKQNISPKDTQGQQLINNDLNTYTYITYHGNGKVKSQRDIYAVKGADTIRVIDPVTLEEYIKTTPETYRVWLHGYSVEFDSAGNKLDEVRYIYGNREGVRKEWYSNGNQKSEENYVLGDLKGECRYWHPNGAIQRVQQMPVGAIKEYYPSGQLKAEGNYIFAQGDTVYVINPITLEEEKTVSIPAWTLQDGKWTYYDEKGKVIRREMYVKGVKK